MDEQRGQAYVKLIEHRLGCRQETDRQTDAAGQCLLETLQLVWETQGEPQQVYPVWV